MRKVEKNPYDGKLIAVCRKSLGISQRELGQLCVPPLSSATITQIESNRVALSQERAECILEALNRKLGEKQKESVPVEEPQFPLGKYIAAYRAALDISQKELGNLCVPPMKQAKITQIETGKIKITEEMATSIYYALNKAEVEKAAANPTPVIDEWTVLSKQEKFLLSMFREDSKFKRAVNSIMKLVEKDLK